MSRTVLSAQSWVAFLQKILVRRTGGGGEPCGGMQLHTFSSPDVHALGAPAAERTDFVARWLAAPTWGGLGAMPPVVAEPRAEGYELRPTWTLRCPEGGAGECGALLANFSLREVPSAAGNPVYVTAVVKISAGTKIALLIDRGDGVWRRRECTYSASGAGTWLLETFEATMLGCANRSTGPAHAPTARFGLAVSAGPSSEGVALASVRAGPVFG